MKPPRASDGDRDHFRAIAQASGPLPDDAPPRSLAEMFDRLEAIRRSLGPAARPGGAVEDESELEAHLRVLRRGLEIWRHGDLAPEDVVVMNLIAGRWRRIRGS